MYHLNRIRQMRVGRAASVVLFVTIAAADLGAQIRTRVQASGFDVPIAFVQDPTDRATQFVVQQNGRIRVLRSGAILPRDLLDVSAAIVSGGEQGLLGLAFPRNATTTRRVFVDFPHPSRAPVVSPLRRPAA